MPTRRGPWLGFVFCLLAVLITKAPPASAQPSDDGDDGQEEAVRLFEQSVGEYRAGRFQNAVDLLRRAYQAHPEPTLLYNLGRALEGLGDEAGAIDGYARYLEAQPNAPDRGALEHRIETLRQRLQERQALAEQREREREREQERQREGGDSQDHARSSSGPGLLPWVVAAAGGVVVATGGVLGVLAQGQADDADGGATQQAVWDDYQGAKSTATAANVCFIAGAVIASVGLAWGIIGNLGAGRDDEAGADEVRTAGPRVAYLPPGGVVVSW